MPADAGERVSVTWLQAGAGRRGRATLTVPVARPSRRLAVSLERDGDVAVASVTGEDAGRGATIAILGGDDAALAEARRRFDAFLAGAPVGVAPRLRRLTELFAARPGGAAPRAPDPMLTTYGARPASPLAAVTVTRTSGAGEAAAVTLPAGLRAGAVALGPAAEGFVAGVGGGPDVAVTAVAPVVARAGDRPEVGVRLAHDGDGVVEATVRVDLRDGSGVTGTAGLSLGVPEGRPLAVTGSVGAALAAGPLAITADVTSPGRASQRVAVTVPADPAPRAPALAVLEVARGPKDGPIALAWPRGAEGVVVTVSRGEEAALAGAVDALFEVPGGGTALLGWRLLAVAGGPGQDDPRSAPRLSAISCTSGRARPMTAPSPRTRRATRRPTSARSSTPPSASGSLTTPGSPCRARSGRGSSARWSPRSRCQTASTRPSSTPSASSRAPTSATATGGAAAPSSPPPAATARPRGDRAPRRAPRAERRQPPRGARREAPPLRARPRGRRRRPRRRGAPHRPHGHRRADALRAAVLSRVLGRATPAAAGSGSATGVGRLRGDARA
ncbi:MAG: hypothetical protein H6745_02320 [Deltaproteobacteria bacterium]|nr:hypothetical protein [Deltaproteobacteria bacterium]